MLHLTLMYHATKNAGPTLLAFSLNPSWLCDLQLCRIYDTSSNDTSSTGPFRRKGFLLNVHFVETGFRRILSTKYSRLLS